MLADFFALDTPFEKFDEQQLASHLKISNDLRCVLYQPEAWPENIRRVKSSNFTNVSLSKTNFSEVTFTDCKFEDCLFVGSQFRKVEFHRCWFVNCNFYKTIFEECYIDPGTIRFDKKYRETHSNIGVHVFQQLYENSSKSRQNEFEMKADIRFHKWKRWQSIYDRKKGRISNFQWFRGWVVNFIYEWLTGFGYKPMRFIIATIVFLFILSLFNMMVLREGLMVEGHPMAEMTLMDSISYTFSTLTGRRFVTFLPYSLPAKILGISEALVGIGWLGLFTSLLVKRFLK